MEWGHDFESGKLRTGATELIRTPAGAHSIDSDLVRLSTPALAAPE